MPSAVEITERLLSDAGGWQALKEAKGLWEAGKVEGASYEPPFLRGTVRDGVKEYRSGLRLVTRTNIENLCSCRISRERGMVCAHALAVGIQLLKGGRGGLEAPSKPDVPMAGIGRGAMEKDPTFSEDEITDAVLHVIVAPSFTSGWEKNSVTLGLEIEADGRRVLAHALPAGRTCRVSAEDMRAVQIFRQVNGGELPGMMVLNRKQSRLVFAVLAGHPRVTMGRGERINPILLLPADLLQPAASAAGGEPILPGKPVFQLQIEGSLSRLAAKLQAQYGDRTVTAGSRAHEPLKYMAEGKWRSRNLDEEAAARARLTGSGFGHPDETGEMLLRGERPILQFLAGVLPGLQSMWKVELGSRFTTINQSIERVRPKVEVQGSGTDWFELSVSLRTSEGQTFSSAEIQRLLQMGQNHVRMRSGALAIFDTGLLDELGQALADCGPRQLRPGTYRIPRAQAGYLESVLGERVEVEGSADWHRWTGLQLKPDQLKPVPLGDLEHILRPYQKQGVYWMDFLARNGFGGILADEMGLGKTLQALAFIAELRKRSREAMPSLIVCPSTLVQNWAREAAKFTPELRVLTLDGPERLAQIARIPEADIAITSYALLRRDAGHYGALQFSAVILDEAQHIKNPETQNAQAAASLKARHRMVLTGTPLENSVRDLWSIMNFAMPGYLGTRADFKERYEQPILQGEAGALKGRLAKRIRPFLLRRLKRDVSKELPEKIEQVVYVELTKQQQEVYENLLSESRRQIVELSGEKDRNKGRMLMLTALLRLRQACCDLRLLGLADLDQEAASAKLAMLDELLREAIDGGHRVLIFSQFVAMLKLQKAALEAAGIPFCYLDGQTKDRMNVVDSFQNGVEIPVFLISLKAGGVGLNLTAADTVVHFDPWWNPAVEAQATDRAHRIGQEKVVTAYKLIARGTVEEKILKLQETKRGLMDAIESEEPVMGGLSTTEIQDLLS